MRETVSRNVFSDCSMGWIDENGALHGAELSASDAQSLGCLPLMRVMAPELPVPRWLTALIRSPLPLRHR